VGVDVAGLDTSVPTSAQEWATASQRSLAHQERDATYLQRRIAREDSHPSCGYGALLDCTIEH